MNPGNKNNNIYQEIMLKLFRIAQEAEGNSIHLPTLRVLAEQFGCTAPTVLRAVRALIERGILAPLEKGGYRTIPQNVSGKTCYIAVALRGGMDLLDDPYSMMIKYYATKDLSNLTRNLYFSELHAMLRGDIGNTIRSGEYNGMILCFPNESIIPEAADACREKNIPLGIFGGNSDSRFGDFSMTYDVERDFRSLFEELVRRKRRRILLLSLPVHDWNDVIRRAMNDFSGSFEKIELLSVDIGGNIDSLLRNTGGAGENYDCVVYTVNSFDSYEKLQRHAPDCLCVVSDFGTFRKKNFRGLVMHFDLDAASLQFGEAMSALLNKRKPENPRGIIPCSIQEIREEGSCPKNTFFRENAFEESKSVLTGKNLTNKNQDF